MVVEKGAESEYVMIIVGGKNGKDSVAERAISVTNSSVESAEEAVEKYFSLEKLGKKVGQAS